MPEVFPTEIKGHVNQGYEHRNLHQGAYNRCKGLGGVNAENGHGHGDGQFKIITGGSMVVVLE